MLLVVCEGKVTEPSYLRGYERALRSNRLRLKIARETGDPRRVVEIAQTQHGDADYDEVWCVFDRDEHDRFRDALAMARANGFHVAWSNPCVELWLWLHFADNPGARHRHDLQRMLRDQHLPGYVKDPPFDAFKPHVLAAEERAERLTRERAARGDDPYGNPSTGFHCLTRSMREG